MTEREKEIEKACKEFIKKNHSELQDDDFALGLGFQEGWKAADENPKDPNDIIIDLIHQRSIAFDQVREEMDKNEKLRQQLAIAKEALEGINGQIGPMCMSDRLFEKWAKIENDKIRKALAQISEVGE